MESNADKELREKLKGFEVPYDPEAWGQMEAMLDEKKKRRGFFWWWFGGIAAGLLLFGVLGYHFGKQQVTNKELAANETTTTSGNKERAATGHEQGSAGNSGSNTTVQSSQQTIPANGTQPSTTANNINSGTSIKGNGNNNAALKGGVTAGNNSKLPTGTGEAKTTGVEQGTGSNKKAVNKRDKEKAVQLAADSEEESPKQVSAKGVKANPSATNAPVTTETVTEAKEEQQAEVEAINLMWADKLGKEEDKLNADKKEEKAFPKKKKIFRYSVGAMGGIYATTPGWKHYNNDIGLLTLTAPMEKASKPAFYSKPTWMVGLTHDFTFYDRFAFTNGLLYSETEFKVYAPYAQGFSFAPEDYTCKISELAIPTGIKIYPVETPKFRLYVSAGFIHHVKLEESFSYTYTPPPPVSLNVPGVADNNYNFFPTNTVFNGEGQEVVKSADFLGNLETVTANTTDFSINRAKRYYTSFYAGLGVEGIIKKHWILFAEPTYSMTLQRIGYQERRKFNFGGNMGFRYQF